MATVGAVAAALAEFAPPALAEAWDNVGLLVGDPAAGVGRVLCALDVTDAVLDEALALGAELVVAFHPPLFRPVARVRADVLESRLAWRAARAGVALYATHTALDNRQPGTSDFLAAALGVSVDGVLAPRTLPGPVKLVVFCPREATERVAASLAEAGAGVIGDYEACSFRVAGTGAFRPLPGAQPTIGAVGALEQVAEDRLEMLVPRPRLDAVTAALRAAHPYEEVAYDVYAREAEPAGGMGRLGRLAAPLALSELARRCEEALGARCVRFVGAGARRVSRVALVGGSGASYAAAAAAAGAEVLVTGDVKHHDALLATKLGLALVDPGHFAGERPVVGETAAWLRRRLPALAIDESRVDGEPFALVGSRADAPEGKTG